MWKLSFLVVSLSDIFAKINFGITNSYWRVILLRAEFVIPAINERDSELCAALLVSLSDSYNTSIYYCY